MTRAQQGLVASVWLLAASCQKAPPQTNHAGDLRTVGRVELAISCQGQQDEFDQSLALLHSFFYQEARRQFTEITTKDPSCAIAYWGIAMTWYHPLWSQPSAEDLERGRAAITQASRAATKSDREKAFVDALAVFYAVPAANAELPGGGISCHGPTEGHSARAVAYANAMEKMYAAHPDDVEEGAFYALALLGSAKPVDPTLENQRKAAAILEKFWTTRRNHPGIAHYLIHAYDSPQLAAKGLEAANAYAAIAPRVAHALHMPAHIFVRLGMWNEAVKSNLASMDAARDYEKQIHQDGTSFEELHALDYLVYSYLQLGQDAKAREMVDTLASVKKTDPEIDFVASYAMGAIPARYALERHAWAEAASLTVPAQAFWVKFPFTEGLLEYARGLGRARSGDIAGARKSLVRLGQLHDATTDPKFDYFKQHLALQQQAVSAWIDHAEGHDDQAIATLRAAAATEDLLGKHPVSPGPVIMIGEQLGDLLLETGKTSDALAAYETVLKSSPGRLDAILGAGIAAEKGGKLDVARGYYQTALDQTRGGDSMRLDLVHARKIVANR